MQHDTDCTRRCIYDKVHSLTECTCKCGINLYDEWLHDADTCAKLAQAGDTAPRHTAETSKECGSCHE